MLEPSEAIDNLKECFSIAFPPLPLIPLWFSGKKRKEEKDEGTNERQL